MTFHLIGFHKGARTVVGTVYGSRECAETSAAVHAHLRGEYIDVEQNGRLLATCDGQGVVPPFADEFRSMI